MKIPRLCLSPWIDPRIQSEKLHFSSTRLSFLEIHLYRGWLLPSPPATPRPPLYLPNFPLNHRTQRSCNLRAQFMGRSAKALHYLSYNIWPSHAVFSTCNTSCCLLRSFLPPKAGFKYHLPSILPLDITFSFLQTLPYFFLNLSINTYQILLYLYMDCFEGRGKGSQLCPPECPKWYLWKVLNWVNQNLLRCYQTYIKLCSTRISFRDSNMPNNSQEDLQIGRKISFCFILLGFLKNWIWMSLGRVPKGSILTKALPYIHSIMLSVRLRKQPFEIVAPARLLKHPGAMDDEESLQSTHGASEKPRQASMKVVKPRGKMLEKLLRRSTEKGKQSSTDQEEMRNLL